MRVWDYRNSSKAARLRMIGSLSLVIGLSLWVFVIPSVKFQPNLMHFAAGLFFGISIVTNLKGFRMARCKSDSGVS